MFLASKTNEKLNDWQPCCHLDTLQLRAKMLASIRQFFTDKNILEVETPVLGQHIGTDPHLDFFDVSNVQRKNQTMFLQTSPEFAMKRLLAAGSGSIYQICKAFRKEEQGALHNPEFSLLEWYRIDFDIYNLMDEVTLLLKTVLTHLDLSKTIEKVSYQEIFRRYTGVDPLTASIEQFTSCAKNHGFMEATAICEDNFSVWLDFMFSHLVQPNLGYEALCFVYHYPASQSALARINLSDPRVADRFEVFVQGVELANGFHELQDPVEQERRFDQENALRLDKNLLTVQKDNRLLDALKSGLPNCSGVALGLDRLLMLICGTATIDAVLAFPFDRA